LEQLLSQRKASAENGRGLFRSRHCVEVLNKLQVEGKVPSSAEEGWMRDYKNAAKQPKFAQTGGVDQVQFNSLDQHHPGRSNKVASHFFLVSQPPLPLRRGLLPSTCDLFTHSMTAPTLGNREIYFSFQTCRRTSDRISVDK